MAAAGAPNAPGSPFCPGNPGRPVLPTTPADPTMIHTEHYYLWVSAYISAFVTNLVNRYNCKHITKL